MFVRTMGSSGFLQAITRRGSKIASVITIAALLLSGVPLPSNVALAATTATLLPTGDGAYAVWIGDWTDVNEGTGSPSCSNADSAISATSGQRESYTVSLASIPDGSTIQSIAVTASDRGDVSAGGTYQTFVRLNGTDQDSGVSLTVTGNSGGCTNTRTQLIDVVDVAKVSGTTLEIGVVKGNATGVRLGAISATVTYAPPTYTITSSAGTGGSISPSGANVVDGGTSQTYTITPSATYVVSDVIVDSVSSGRLNSHTFSFVTAGHTISASFDGGWSAPASTANNVGVANPTNAYASNDAWAIFDSQNDEVEYTTFGLSIPTGAVIQGVEVAVEGNRTDPRTVNLQLSWNGGTTFTAAKNLGPTFTATDATVVVGGTADTWGRAWTTADFSDTNFRVLVDAQSSGPGDVLSIDQLQVRVTYVMAGQISGRIFNDLDGNGVDGAEPALTGWTVGLYQGETLVQATTSTLAGYAFTGLSDGEYDVCETLEVGYYQTQPTTTPTCANGTHKQSVAIAGGNTVAGVTFGNAAYGSLVVTVATDPDTTNAAFGLTSSATTSPVFTITDGGAGDDSESLSPLVAGTYTLATTSVPEGWVLESAACSDGSPFEAVVIAPGETVTCTYTYTKPPTLTVQKVSIPGSGPFSIGVSGPTTTTLSLMANSSDMLSGIPIGAYTVSETIPEATAQTMTCVSTNAGNGSAQAAFSQTDGDISFSLGAGENMTCTVNNTPYSIIVGTKVEDANGTGAGIVGSGVAAWPFTLYKLIEDPETEGEDWVVSDTEATNSGGAFTFAQVLPGTYKVCEGTQATWYQSYPTAGAACSNGTTGYQLTIPDVPAAGAGETYGDGEGEGDSTFAFANYRRGSISGNKFEDLDADGVWDSPGEPGIDGWSIYLDLNENGTNDAEPTVVTSGGGHYEFENLSPGTYRIREVIPAATDWVQVVPSAGYYTEALVSGESASAFNFGNVHGGTLSGFKWNDTDGDGVFEEEGIPGVAFTIQLYRVSGETEVLASTTLTSVGSGEYSFTHLLPGTYRVKEAASTGWVQTYPLSGGYHQVIVGVDEDVEGVKFGNAKVSTVSGLKYWDADKNSEYGEEEVLSGWTITAVPMSDTDEGEGVVLTADSGRSTKTDVTGEDGVYEFSFMPSDFGWWRVAEVQQIGWEQAAPTTTGYYDIQVIGDMEVTGKHFGNWKKPVVTVMKWSDADNDGVRDWNDATTTGSIGIKDEGEEYTEGLLAGWPIFVAEGYATDTPNTVDLHVIAMATTSADGAATIYLPKTGTFYVIEGKQDGWNRTYPTGSGVFGENTIVLTFADGVSAPAGFTVDTSTYFSIAAPTSGIAVTTGIPAGVEGPATALTFGNYDVPAPTAPSTSGSTSGGGGGNGPIAGSSGIAPGFVTTIIPTTGGGTSGGTGGGGATEGGVGGSPDGDLGAQGAGTEGGGVGGSGGGSGVTGGGTEGGAGGGTLGEEGGGVLSDEAVASLAAAAQAFSNPESDTSQLASAASTIGDLMETYWWLLALIVLLLGSAWVAYQRYTA